MVVAARKVTEGGRVRQPYSKVRINSVADPDPEGSKTFGQIQIRSGTEINVTDPDSIPDPKPDSNPDPNKSVKGALHSGQNKVVSYGTIIHISHFLFQGII